MKVHECSHHRAALSSLKGFVLGGAEGGGAGYRRWGEGERRRERSVHLQHSSCTSSGDSCGREIQRCSRLPLLLQYL